MTPTEIAKETHNIHLDITSAMSRLEVITENINHSRFRSSLLTVHRMLSTAADWLSVCRVEFGDRD